MDWEHAPPPTAVDGLLAVPVDITSVTATLAFDAAAKTATGTATVDFVVGPTAGNPMFDLRQTITAATLDGAPIAPALLAHHDLGGGADAQLRVLAQALPAGSAHTLTLAYALGTPQSPQAQPIGWEPATPRVFFDLWFTDLLPGRYLEMWVPANLVYDQFALHLTIRVDNTAVAHRLFTNGAVTPVAANHWTVDFPADVTALSPMLVLAAADRVQVATGSVALPGHPTPVALETFQRTSTSFDLAAVNAALAAHLPANVAEVGPYLHGDRFTTYVWPGSRSMEYDGATTSNVAALEHEVFHSWYGRGVKPARQNDGWLDEAYTSWTRDQGAPAQSFAASDPPVQLSPRNPFNRVTPGASYGPGARFFAGLAARFGVGTVRTLMADFYAAHQRGLVTTEDLLVHLVVRTGEPALVDWFARWVYGFGSTAGTPDLWLRDAPGDPGADGFAGAFWDSPDLWVRHAPDGGTAHQDPEHGQDNWFYARVRNRGSAPAPVFAVAFAVRTFAGTEFAYPADYLPPLTAAVGFDLAPGASTVVSARWPAAAVPAAGTHACWLAAVLAPFDAVPSGRHAWEHNNLAQKNLTVVDLVPGDSAVVPVQLGSLLRRTAEAVRLEVLRPRHRPDLAVALVHRDPDALRRLVEVVDLPVTTPEPPAVLRLVDPGRIAVGALSGAARLGVVATAGSRVELATPVADPPRLDDDAGGSRGRGPALPAGVRGGVAARGRELVFPAGARGAVAAGLRPFTPVSVGLRVTAPRDGRPGETYDVDLVQRAAGGAVVGGVRVRVVLR